MADETISEGLQTGGEDADTVQTAIVKRRYPYAPVFFLLAVTVGQSYVSCGLQAVLEFYFVHYLFVCSGTERATSLGTTSVNIYIAIYQISAISAGFLADKVLGNFFTQVLSVILTGSGIFLLVFSTWQFSISEPQCCYSNSAAGTASASLLSVGDVMAMDSHGQHHVNWNGNCSELHKEILLGSAGLNVPPSVVISLAVLGLVLYAIGYGHINTLQSVFVADQFEEEESEPKRRSFSWFYLCCNLGALGGESGLPVLRQSLGFIIAWLTLLGSTSVTTVIFLSGSCLYVKKRPQNCCSLEHGHKGSLNTNSECAPLLKKVPDKRHPFPLFSWLRQQLPFLGVFGPLVIFWAVFYQQNTTWVVQGTHMNCHIGRLHVPPDLMPCINDFLVVSIIPIMEYIVYPHLERVMKMKILPLHKLIAGMSSAALSFLMSGLLQLYVSGYHDDDCHGNISIAWQLPQLFLISIAEAIVCVTGLEFAYSQASPQHRNLVTAMWYLSQALGTLLNAGVAQIPGLNLLQEFFMYMALMSVVTVIFATINRRFRYRTPD